MLKGKKILLGVTGSISAYKIPQLARQLCQEGAFVRVVLSSHALSFVTPITFTALGCERVLVEAGQEKNSEHTVQPMDHIHQVRWADLILVAPATAHFISRITLGLGDDLLTTMCLARRKELLALAPAMNVGMWENPAIQQHVKTLKAWGVDIWGPDKGLQACGEIGAGRLKDTHELLDHIKEKISPSPIKKNSLTFLITGGPTKEPLDPVRFLSNHSSGQMAYALCEGALKHGASQIHLVLGPVSSKPNWPKSLPIHIHPVETAREMYDQVIDLAPKAQIFVGAAAVADYRVKITSSKKMKKSLNTPHQTLELVENPDILASLSQRKNLSHLYRVGFSAETNNLEQYSLEKLKKKKCHMLIGNLVGKNLGFHSDKNQVRIFFKSQDNKKQPVDFPKMSKGLLGEKLVALILQERHRVKNLVAP